MKKEKKSSQEYIEALIEEAFEPVIDEEKYWIFDNKKNCFVKLKVSNKFIWNKSGHAKNAFINWVENILNKNIRSAIDNNKVQQNSTELNKLLEVVTEFYLDKENSTQDPYKIWLISKYFKFIENNPRYEIKKMHS